MSTDSIPNIQLFFPDRSDETGEFLSLCSEISDIIRRYAHVQKQDEQEVKRWVTSRRILSQEDLKFVSSKMTTIADGKISQYDIFKGDICCDEKLHLMNDAKVIRARWK